jgi:integrase/recombinase XerD
MPRRGHRKLRSVDRSDPQSMWCRLEDFCEWMAVRNFSSATVRTRRVAVELFIRWAADRGLTRAGEVTKPVVERYQRHLYYARKSNGRALSFGTQHGRLASLRVFFSWLARNNFILYNPAADIELPKLERRLPAVLTRSEVEHIMMQPDVTTAIGIRDRAMLETLYSTGMRRAELAGLSLYSIDSSGGTVVIRNGKGNKDRVVPIGRRALRWMERYLHDVRPELVVEPDPASLLLTRDGLTMLPRNVSRVVRFYLDAAEIAKEGCCHLFRHTMATQMLENGADVRLIQVMLGHSKLTTTEVYTHVSIRHLKQVHEATHPARDGRSEAEPSLAECGAEE